MVKIIEPKIETAELRPDGSYGKFIAEPLDRGFGITLGNSLRRVLLSSLPGVAVSSIKIDGVQHEFTTIPGVKEDVVEIILNIKGLIAKLHGEEPVTVHIAAEGECEVTAGCITGSSEVEILDPTMHIATLAEGAKLNMELVLQKGQGYDLSKYSGKKVMRYVYEINNYPGAQEPVYATVLVYKNKVIGGDVTDTAAQGKIRGFQMPTVIPPATQPATQPTTQPAPEPTFPSVQAQQ